MENLENLNNADLREKCIQYGLPNVPITDSSRNVLIRKLRASISNSASLQISNRRKTINGLKDSSKPGLPAHGLVRRTIVGTSKGEASKNVNKSVKKGEDAKILRQSVENKGFGLPCNGEKNNINVLLKRDDEEERDLLMSTEKMEKIEKENISADGSLRASHCILSRDDEITTSRSQAGTVFSGFSTSKLYNLGRGSAFSDSKIASETNKTKSSLSKNGYLKENPIGSVGSCYLENGTQSFELTSCKSNLENDESYETPYLSNFARKLELLKAASVASLVSHECGTVNSEIRTKDIRVRKYRAKKTFRQRLIAVDGNCNLNIYVVLASIFFGLVLCYILLLQ